MAGTHGTSLFRFKRAWLDLIDAATSEKVSYQSPEQAQDVLGDSGSGIACWFTDEAVGEHSHVAIKGAPVWMDEVAHPVLRIQSVGMDTDASQETVDGRASQILYYAIKVLLADPSAGLTDDDIQEFAAVPESWTYAGGVMSDGKRSARIDLTAEVTARLKFS